MFCYTAGIRTDAYGRRVDAAVKISCIQMNVRAAAPEQNFVRAELLIRRAAQRRPDVIVLPETWNTGFAPGKIDPALADEGGARTKALCAALAKELSVNIVAGSVTNRRRGGVYNTAYVFDRAGGCVAEYDKTHLFSPAGEAEAYTRGMSLPRFSLDGVRCGLMICYDIRFPELARSLALPGLDLLFVVAEWPRERISQLGALLKARAIENQTYAALCNGCGEAFGVRFGGRSAIVSPLGETLTAARAGERIISARIDPARPERIRSAIPVWNDRRPELYGALCQTVQRQE